MTRRVELRPAAERDLVRPAQFVARFSKEAAIKRARALREAVRALGDQATPGVALGDGRLRQAVLRLGRARYVVRFVIAEEEIVVTRIWHGREARQPR